LAVQRAIVRPYEPNFGEAKTRCVRYYRAVYALGFSGEIDMDGPTDEQLMAIGEVGFALALQTLAMLKVKGVINDQDGRNVIDGALLSIEQRDAREPHESHQLARTILGQLQTI